MAEELQRLVADKVKNFDFESFKNDAARQLREGRDKLEKGDVSWKYASVLAGGMLCLVSFLGLASSIMSLSPMKAVLHLYIFAFGVIFLVLEYPDSYLPRDYVVSLKTEALFLTKAYGRAVFYFFVGLLVSCIGGLLNLVVGIVTAAVGIYVFHSSRNAYRELAEVQRAASSSGKSPAALFDDYDADRNGTLDTCELAKLTSALGSPLSLNELESALVILDRDGSGKVEKSEFLAWFSAAKV